MERYQDTTVFVDAVQWFLESDDPRVTIQRATGYLAGRTRLDTFENYTFTGGKSPVPIHPGDWIVSDGAQTYVVRQDEFKRRFRRAEVTR